MGGAPGLDTPPLQENFLQCPGSRPAQRCRVRSAGAPGQQKPAMPSHAAGGLAAPARVTVASMSP